MSLQSWQETLVTAQVDGAAHTTAAAASIIPAAAKFTLPPNFFATIGKQLRVWASGRVSLAVTTPGTLRFDVRFGGTVVFDGLAIVLDTAGYTNVGWFLDLLLTCRAIGTSANLMGQGEFRSTVIAGQPTTPPKGGLTAILPWNSAPAVGSNFDSTASQAVDLFMTQTVATHSLTLHQYQLVAVN
jgi:hypothetical protein